MMSGKEFEGMRSKKYFSVESMQREKQRKKIEWKNLGI